MDLRLRHFRPRPGQHCETSTLGMMLAHEGLVLSEPMIFGLGAGLDFQLWPSPMPRRLMPIASGRIESGAITRNLSANLGVEIVVQEAETVEAAQAHAAAILGRDRVAGLKLDIFYLDYFHTKRHFAAHYIALHGIDGDHALVVDTEQQGGTHRIPLARLALARDSREGYQPSRNLSMYVERPPALRDAAPSDAGAAITSSALWGAIRRCARRFLTDRTPSCGPAGVRTTAQAMRRWDVEFDEPRNVVNGIGHFWRSGGTGGANFRRLYREFLAECGEHLDAAPIRQAVRDFDQIVAAWDAVIDNLLGFGRDGDRAHLDSAAARFSALAALEEGVMSRLLDAADRPGPPERARSEGPASVGDSPEVREVKTICRMCHGGCGAIVTLRGRTPVDIRGDTSSAVSEGFFCAKGKAALGLLGGDRLTTPLRRVVHGGRSSFEPITWDEALGLVAARIRSAVGEHGAESVVLAQGTDRNYQEWIFRFANVLGTPNVVGPAHVCFYPRVMASIMTFGGFTFSDYDGGPDTIVLWGSNKLHTHSDGVIGIKLARAIQRGAKLIVIDPVRTALARQSDCWLQVRPGTDGALALGMLNLVIESRWYDEQFVAQHTVGFDQLKAHVAAYDLATTSRLTGLSPSQIRRATELYATSSKATIEAGTGISQNRNAFDTLRSVFMLSALCGNLDAEGGDVIWNPMPVDGRRTFPLTELLPKEQAAKRLGGGEHRILSMTGWAHPDALWDAIITGRPYTVSTLLVFGSNLLASHADTARVHQALSEVEFLVICDLFMTPTAQLADVVLPVSSWLERDQIVEFNAYVGARRKLAQVGDSKSDEEIVLELAARLGLSRYFWPTVHAALDDKLEGIGHTWDSFKDLGFLPNVRQYRKYQARGFFTPSGRVNLYHAGLEKMGYPPLPVYVHEALDETDGDLRYVLTSAHSLYFYNSEYRQIARLRDRQPAPRLTLHPDAAEREGIHAGDRVVVHTAARTWGVEFEARISRDVPPDVVLADPCWWYPETADLTGSLRSSINSLTGAERRNPQMGSNELRGFRVGLSRAAGTERRPLTLGGDHDAG